MNWFTNLLNTPYYELREPKPGVRNQPEAGKELVAHRFPVKGGKTPKEMLRIMAGNPNPLWYMVTGEECPPATRIRRID